MKNNILGDIIYALAVLLGLFTFLGLVLKAIF